MDTRLPEKLQLLMNWSEADDIIARSNISLYYFNGSALDNYEEGAPFYMLLTMCILYAVILLCGVVGNVSTCIVIARNKHMHTATNYYLFSLAVSDMILLLAGLPQEIMHTLFKYPYTFGETACVMTGLASETSANATVLTITAFTVERYVAICHPFLSHTFSKLSRAIKFVFIIWLFALILAIPQAIQFGIVEVEMNSTFDEPVLTKTMCTLKKDASIEPTFLLSTCLFFIAPMTLITVLYILIGLKLRRSRLLKRPSITGNHIAERQNQKSQNHVIRMLIVVVVAFFICWAPFHAQRLLALYASSQGTNSETVIAIYNILTHTSGILYYLSTTINPLLYNIMSHKFRDAFKGTLAQLCGWSEKETFAQRKYSVLSRGPTLLNHSRVGHQSSISWGNQDIMLQLHKDTSRQSITVPQQVTNISNKETSPLHQASPASAVVPKRLQLFHLKPSQMSIESHTISNSSLQDYDEPEFTGSELAHYMGELNRR
uniref:Neuropeptide GPCR A35 n=1 Tax=Nilaparvata lugens TaxID=108931 RepID=U3U7P2_NILLU|nr:neuropeptide GPCR A35 [Nilaparvata lugens]